MTVNNIIRFVTRSEYYTINNFYKDIKIMTCTMKVMEHILKNISYLIILKYHPKKKWRFIIIEIKSINLLLRYKAEYAKDDSMCTNDKNISVYS